MKKLAAVISATLMMSSAASAANDIYIGAKAGKSWANDACTTAVCDDDSHGYGVFLGQNISDNVALEFGYDDLGKFTGDGMTDDSATAFTIAPKVTLPVLDKFDVYGKLGVASVDYGSERDPSFMGAVGVDVHATDKLSVRLEYQTLTDVNNDLVRAQLNTTSIGLLYKFGTPAQPVVEAVEPAPVVEEVVAPTVTMQKLNMKLDSSSSFATASAELSPVAKTQIAEVVAVLKQYPQAVVSVTGHTDSVGSEAYNQKLSEKRAQAVANEIIAQGVDSSRVTAAGKGELQPVASNDTETGREMNRRVEIDVPSFEYEAAM
jgi:OOP family OmpA-OmpF porin